MRAVPQQACSEDDNVDNILGIIRYGDSTQDPTSQAYDLQDSCDDEDPTSLVPYVSYTVGASADVNDETAALGGSGDTILWTMNDISFVSQWNYPSVLAIADGNTSWSTEQHVWTNPTANQWVYLIVDTTFAQAHPIHLHGHDFWVLGSGTGTYDEATATLNKANPPRRDTAMLPGNGWLALAWYTDNPGAWLMHCKLYPDMPLAHSSRTPSPLTFLALKL